VRYRVLGPLEVENDHGPVTLGGQKERLLLALLLTRPNQIVPVEALVEGLWGEQPPPTAAKTLQSHVVRLRRALEPGRARGAAGEVLVTREPGYLLRVAPGALDATRFEELTAAARRALTDGSAERAGSLLREALGLWRGRAFEEFLGTDFGAAESDRLAELRLGALEDRIEADLRLGRHRELVAELEALVREHPLREELHQLLLLSLYRAGRQAEALEAYQRARKILAGELGIDPGHALQELELAILAQDRRLDWTPPSTEPGPSISQVTPTVPVASTPAPTWPTDATPASRTTTTATGLLPVVWNVPMRNPHFTGRTSLLEQLHRRLHAGEHTLVVQALYGLGGVGKTQLAIEYAHRFATDYELVWWINAEQPVLLPEQFARLADKLNLPPRATAAGTVELVTAELRQRSGWLLIFDNAERPEHLAPYQPGGNGHVLVTSRSPGWGAMGGRLEVDVLNRLETVALLQRRIPELDARLADELAAELGDLPLAAAQAAAYLEQTGLPPADYAHRFRTRRASMLAKGDVLGYQGRVDTTWTISLERLHRDSPAAVPLLQLAAFLAPEPIPLRLFTAHPELLDEPLRTAAADQDTLDDSLGAVVGLSLARRQSDSFQLHRLVQAVIRQQVTSAQQQRITDQVLALLAAAYPGDPNDPANGVAYAQLAPHVLVTSALGDDRADNRRLMLSTVEYLNTRGDSQASRLITQQVLDRWRHCLGPDHPDSLQAATFLTAALGELGEAEKAHRLGHDTLERCQRILGPTHLTTLTAAAVLTFVLLNQGEAEQARRLGQDILERCQVVLGPDHPISLRSAAVLTFALGELGEAEQARQLGQDTLERCRRVLGPEHMVTLSAAASLTFALLYQGELEQARQLGQDTLERSRRVLGPNHMTTVASAASLTFALLNQGDAEEARRLGEDTLERSRRVFGPDHAVSVASAASLTFALAGLGEAEQARLLGQDTLQRCTRVLSPDHLITLSLAQALDSLSRHD
jgi:DNA-binding SARP family transcriptional activator